MFSILICIKEKNWHFASFRARALNAVQMKRVCKSGVRKHSDERVLDHNRNLQKFDLREYIASSLTAVKFL